MRFLLQVFRKVSNVLTILSGHVIHLTGRAAYPLHPKHLYTPKENVTWYAADIRPKDKVLDIGANHGAHTDAAAQAALAVAGDITMHAPAAWEKRLKEQNNCHFLLFDAEKGLPFPKGVFDKVLFLDVLEHINHRHQALAEVARVLAPGGVMFLSVPNVETSFKQMLKRNGLFHYMDEDHKIEYEWPELVEELRLAGFEVVKKSGIVYDSPWNGFVDFLGALFPPLYRWFAKRKISLLEKYPNETVGWRLLAKVA